MEMKEAVAIVTGAGSGIGRELALAFARSGAHVVCCGRRETAIRETANQITKEGGSSLSVAADVTDQQAVRGLVQRTISAFGKVDLLFANAGSFKSIGPVWTADPGEWWKDVTTNLLGTMLCSREVLPHMMERDRGIIVTMDGGGGADGINLGGSGYGASKAAVVRFTEGLARELEHQGSHVLTFCINPGFVHTQMTEGIARHPMGKKWQGFVGEWIAAGKDVPPDSCALATLKLLRIASPELSGRAFSIETDFEEIARSAPEIRKKNLYVMRLQRSGT